jgi:hypothetical protein
MAEPNYVPAVVYEPTRILGRAHGVIKFAEADSSIIHEMVDHREVEKVFDKYNYIPYATVGGRSAMKYAWYLMHAMQFSETKGAIVRKVNNFSLGGQYEITRSYDPYIYNPFVAEDSISKSDWDKYNEWHKTIGLCNENYVSFFNKLGTFEQTNGMRAVEVIHSSTFGQDVVSFNCVKPSELMRKYTGSDSYMVAALSPKWTDGYLQRFPAREVPIWPNYEEYDDGTKRTVVYQISGLYKYYGRPDDIATFVNQYNEWKLNEFVTKQIDSNFIAQTILEVEKDSGAEKPFRDGAMPERTSLQVLKDKFTARGYDPSPVIPMSRSKDSTPFKAHDIKPNMTPKYYESLLGQFESSIHKGNDFPKALMMAETKGFNSSQFMDAFEISSATKLMTHQLRVTSVVNECLFIAAEWTNNEWAKDFSLKPMSAIQRLINAKADAELALQVSNNNEAVINQ